MNDDATLDYKAIQLPRNDGYRPNACPCSTRRLGSDGRFVTKKVSIPMLSMLEPLESLIRQSSNMITCQRAAEIILVALAKTPNGSQAFLDLCQAVALENHEDALRALAELKHEQT